jgi:hypothetical protein
MFVQLLLIKLADFHVIPITTCHMLYAPIKKLKSFKNEYKIEIIKKET